MAHVESGHVDWPSGDWVTIRGLAIRRLMTWCVVCSPLNCSSNTVVPPSSILTFTRDFILVQSFSIGKLILLLLCHVGPRLYRLRMSLVGCMAIYVHVFLFQLVYLGGRVGVCMHRPPLGMGLSDRSVCLFDVFCLFLHVASQIFQCISIS